MPLLSVQQRLVDAERQAWNRKVKANKLLTWCTLTTGGGLFAFPIQFHGCRSTSIYLCYTEGRSRVSCTPAWLLFWFFINLIRIRSFTFFVSVLLKKEKSKAHSLYYSLHKPFSLMDFFFYTASFILFICIYSTNSHFRSSSVKRYWRNERTRHAVSTTTFISNFLWRINITSCTMLHFILLFAYTTRFSFFRFSTPYVSWIRGREQGTQLFLQRS